MENNRQALSATCEKPRTAIKIFIRYFPFASQSRAISPTTVSDTAFIYPSNKHASSAEITVTFGSDFTGQFLKPLNGFDC